MSFFPLSRQQKHDTPHAITTMRITETQPTIKSSFKLIWQFLPANQARQSQLTWASLLITHWPFLLHKSHSVVVAVKIKIVKCIIDASMFDNIFHFEMHLYLYWNSTYPSILFLVGNQVPRDHDTDLYIYIHSFPWRWYIQPVWIWKVLVYVMKNLEIKKLIVDQPWKNFALITWGEQSLCSSEAHSSKSWITTLETVTSAPNGNFVSSNGDSRTDLSCSSAIWASSEPSSAEKL